MLPGPEHSTDSLALPNSPCQPEGVSLRQRSLIRKTDHTHLENEISLQHSSFLGEKKKEEELKGTYLLPGPSGFQKAYLEAPGELLDTKQVLRT